MESNMEEIWKDIKGYEGIYQVSNLGKIRSLDRFIKTKRGERFYKGKILVGNLGTNGYKYVVLSVSGKSHTKYIHNLVSSTFLDVIEGYDVDHINSIKIDNRLENLRYITHFENSSRANKGRHKNNSMENNPNSKKVFGYLDNKIVKEYDCAKKFCNEIGMNYSTFKCLMQKDGIIFNKIHYKYGIKGHKEMEKK